LVEYKKGGKYGDEIDSLCATPGSSD